MPRAPSNLRPPPLMPFATTPTHAQILSLLPSPLLYVSSFEGCFVMPRAADSLLGSLLRRWFNMNSYRRNMRIQAYSLNDHGIEHCFLSLMTCGNICGSSILAHESLRLAGGEKHAYSTLASHFNNLMCFPLPRRWGPSRAPAL